MKSLDQDNIIMTDKPIFFTSQTYINSQRKRCLKEVLSVLFNNPLSFDFSQPVNYQELRLMDYPLIVKYPMDLGTVRAKLKRRAYNLMEECLSDILQIWVNCRLYNPETHWLHSNAVKLDRLTRKLIRNYANEAKFIKQKQEAQNNGKLPELLKALEEYEQQQERVKLLQKAKEDAFQRKCELFIQLLRNYQDNQVKILFLLVHRHCPTAIFSDPSGNPTIDMRQLDSSTLLLLFDQMHRWAPLPPHLLILL